MDSEIQALLKYEVFESMFGSKPRLVVGLGDLAYKFYYNGSNSEEDLATWYDGFPFTNESDHVDIAYLGEDDLDSEFYKLLRDNAPSYRNIKVISDSPLLGKNEIAVFRWDFRAILNMERRQCRVFILNEIAASFDAVARIAGALIYTQKKSFLIHGSSIAVDGKGYLFTGVSGSGKSTVAELSEAQVLNDEISLIQLDNEGNAFVQGTPFYGDLKAGENTKVPLCGMYLLNQSDTLFIEKMDIVKQHLNLLRNVIFFQSDVDSFDKISDLIQNVLTHKSLDVLHFTKDKSFMEVLP